MISGLIIGFITGCIVGFFLGANYQFNITMPDIDNRPVEKLWPEK